MERLKTKKVQDEKELSLIERILTSETNPKIAYIFALDLILVGIDTVRLVSYLISIVFTHMFFFQDFYGSLFNSVPTGNETRATRKIIQRAENVDS